MADRPYLPLFAGMELIRRSGGLALSPVGNLLGNLPVAPSRCVYQITVGQRVVADPFPLDQRGYIEAGGVPGGSIVGPDSNLVYAVLSQTYVDPEVGYPESSVTVITYVKSATLCEIVVDGVTHVFPEQTELFPGSGYWAATLPTASIGRNFTPGETLCFNADLYQS